MADRSTAPGRIALMGLVVAGAMAGMAGAASAQYYYDDDGYDPYPVYGYGYGYRYEYGYAPRPPAVVPRAPAAVSLYSISAIAARRYGLIRIERSIRRDDAYILDGVTAGGQRQRLILDAYAGDLIRRIPLRNESAPSVARADPREERAAPRQRLVPQPPERPPEFKGPAEASAPATTVLPSPAAPPAPEPAAPVEKPPAEASAPATTSPPSPAAPPAPEPVKPAEASAPATVAPPQPAKPVSPSPGATNSETGADKPRLVNPSDVRNTEGTERRPPLSTAAPAAEASAIPPVQNVDPSPSTSKPETPIAPVSPLN